MTNTTTEPTVIQGINVTPEYMERRKVDPLLQRRLEDEATCLEAMQTALAYYKCRVEPDFWQSVGAGGELQANFQMKIIGEDAEQERDCAAYLKELLTNCRCAFAAVAEISPDAAGEPNLSIFICTTW